MKAENRRASKRVAIYARTSMEDRADDKVSIAQQLDDARRLAIKNGWTVVGEYVDRDTSGSIPPQQIAGGKKNTRLALTRVFSDVESGKVDLVVARKIDRISRLRTEEGLAAFRWLTARNAGVALTHESDPILTTPEGELQLTLLLAVAAFERKKIGDNVRAAKDYMRRQGRKISPASLFGYKDGEKSGSVEIDWPRAEIAREIFSRFHAGESRYQVIQWLRREHPQMTARGGKWGGQTLKWILTNPLYIGKADDGEGNLVQSTCYQPLINEAVFYRVQKKLQASAGTKSGDRYVRHLLSSMITCPCGDKLAVMSIQDRATGKTVFHAFYCMMGKATHKPGTRAPQVREQEWDKWAELFLSNAAVRNTRPQSVAELIQIEKLEANLKALTARFAKGDSGLEPTEYFEAVRTIKANVAKARAAIRTAKTKATEDTTPWSRMDLTSRREHLKARVERITAYRAGVLVEYKTNVEAPHADDNAPNGGDAMPIKMWYPFISERRNGRGHFRPVLVPDAMKRLRDLANPEICKGFDDYDTPAGKVLGPCWRDATPWRHGLAD
jgi:DNA invertase Pin-like site-specific DNA recombinase